MIISGQIICWLCSHVDFIDFQRVLLRLWTIFVEKTFYQSYADGWLWRYLWLDFDHHYHNNFKFHSLSFWIKNLCFWFWRSTIYWTSICVFQRIVRSYWTLNHGYCRFVVIGRLQLERSQNHKNVWCLNKIIVEHHKNLSRLGRWYHHYNYRQWKWRFQNWVFKCWCKLGQSSRFYSHYCRYNDLQQIDFQTVLRQRIRINLRIQEKLRHNVFRNIKCPIGY